MTLAVAAPGNQYPAVGELLGRVFERTEFGHAAGALEFALVVPLFGEGHQEPFLALLVLQRHHGLLNVVVVCLELLFEVDGLVVETGEGETDAFELALALDAPAVFGTDVNCDGVEKVLVVVVAGDAAGLLEAENVFKGGTLEFGVGHGGDVDDGVGVGISTSFATTRG